MSITSSKRRFPYPGWAWPRYGRDRLLKAALLPDQNAARAELDLWLREHDLDDIVFADHRLLAAITERHGSALADLPEYPRLKGLQRQLWTRSMMQVHAVLPALQEIINAGIVPLLLKGAARIALNPAMQRQRAHQDVDVLIRQDQIQKAAQILSRQNWQTGRGETTLSAIARAPVTRAINFQLFPWGNIDLHRLAYHGHHYHDALDAVLWEHAEQADYFGLPVLVPAAAERLAMTLSHGALSPESHSDWLIDATDILSGGTVNWKQFADIIEKRKIQGQVKIGLGYIQHELGIVLPSEALQLIEGRVAFGTLLMARPENAFSLWQRLLRRVFLSGIIRAERKLGRTAKAPRRMVSIARNTRGTLYSSQKLTTMTDLPLPPMDNSLYEEKIMLVDIELILKSPDQWRRVELELNSDTENLARFRVLAGNSKSGLVRARLQARIKPKDMIKNICLESRPGKSSHATAGSAEANRYAAIPFFVKQWNIRINT